MNKHFATALACAALLAVVVFAQNSALAAASSIGSVESKIEETGLKYSTESASFRVRFNETGGRKQNVYVKTTTKSVDGTDFVEIYSFAASGKTRPVDAAQMRKLLDGTGRADYELGHWVLLKPSDPGKEWHLYYSVKMPFSASAQAFEAAIRECSELADKKELELVGTDEN